MEFLLASLGTLLVAGAAGISVASLIAKLRAERDLVALLRAREQEYRKIMNPRRMTVSDPKTRARLEELIEDTVKSLGQADRNQILLGLHQPSDRGRAYYVSRLVAKAYTTTEATPTP